jgi:4-methyl-5(b-hydroxyethyl)-thiazole monophosphate biosynthesis
MPTVLAILAEGFEEIETVTPIDVLRRAGAIVTVASLGQDTLVTGRCGLILRADCPLSALDHSADGPLFDCLFLPGGPGVARLRTDDRVVALVRRHASADRWLAAICAAPTVLQDAGVLAPHRYTAHFSVAAELPNIMSTERVVADGRILTSRGAGTALDFGLLLVEKLFDPRKSQEIAKSICA